PPVTWVAASPLMRKSLAFTFCTASLKVSVSEVRLVTDDPASGFWETIVGGVWSTKVYAQVLPDWAGLNALNAGSVSVIPCPAAQVMFTGPYDGWVKVKV